jgi:PTS system cellobiose-specific IIB component
MKKVTLFCAAGMSTSLLVSKMRKAAEARGLEYEIAAHPLSEANVYAPESDIILLGPQVAYKLKATQAQFPDKVIETINMQDYGMMNGEKVIKHVAEVLGDE